MKFDLGKLNIDKFINVPTSLNNLETKINGLDAGKLKTVPIDLEKLSDVVDNELVKNTKFNKLKRKLNSSEKKTPDATTLIHINQYNTDKCFFDKEIPDTGSLVTTTVLNTKCREVENKMPETRGLLTTIVLDTKLSEVGNKIPNHDSYY